MKVPLLCLALIFGSECQGWAQDGCPDLAQGESAQDCPWAGVARTLLAETAASPAKLEADFDAALPDLADGIRKDALRDDFLGLWGQSINYDELAHDQIVSPAILGIIYSFAGRTRVQVADPRITGSIELAGLEHTYGYLFSELKTAYGYKRARWVQGETEAGLGLPPGMLSPAPPEGTLFSNATYFAGQIAFRNDPAELALLEGRWALTPPSLRDFGYSSLWVTRLEETVALADRQIVLRTDFVPYFFAPADAAADQGFLVYSVLDSKIGARLITAFPVGGAFMRGVTASGTMGDHEPITTHYNAYVEGLSGLQVTGSRRLVAP